MAKLQIIANNTKAKDSGSVNASALAISPSYATNLGSGISSIGKAISEIQADLHKIEDTNQFNEIMPKITNDMSLTYNKYKNSSDIINVPKLFDKEVEMSVWKKDLDGYNENVKRLVQQGVIENKAKLKSKLINNLTDNSIYKYKEGIGKDFNQAILNIISGDPDLIGIGSIQFNNLTNNKALEEFFGAQEWKKLSESKQLQLAELMIDRDININPTKVIKNRDTLVKVVGTDKADYYVNKSQGALSVKMKDLDVSRTYQEIKDQDDKIGVFTETLLRIQNFKKDPSLINEAPTAAMLYDLYNEEYINRSMFNMLTTALTDPDFQSDSDVVSDITSAFYSAESFERLEDIKRAVFLDENVLRKIGLQDMTTFTSIVDNAKKNFPAHKEVKEYEQMIKNNIGSFVTNTSRSVKKRTQLDTLKGNILMEYNDYVQQGFSGKDAYLKVLTSSSFLKEAVPTLQVTAKPSWMKEYDLKALFTQSAKEGTNIWDKLNKTSLMNLQGYYDPKANDGKGANVPGHNDYNKFLLELEQLDFLEKIFITRHSLGGLDYALEGKTENPLDLIYKKNKEEN